MSLRSTALLLMPALFVFLSACSSGGGSETPPTPIPPPVAISIADEQAINTLVTTFENAMNDNKIVGSVSQRTSNGEEVYVFEFTEGGEILAPSRLVKTVIQNRNTWRANITFTDNKSGTLFLRGTTLGLSASNITLNPFNVAPLSARAQFSTPAPGKVLIAVQAKGANGIRMEHAFPAEGRDFTLPILGLYAGYANQVEVQFSDVAGNTLVTDILTMQTAALAATFNVNIVQNSLPVDDDGVFMISDNKLAFDQTGEVRWAITDNDVNYVFRKLPNGNMTATNNDTSAVYHFGAFTETTMLGEVVTRYDVPNLIHHEARLSEQTDTYFVATNTAPVTSAASFTDGLSEEDEVIEINRTTRQVVKSWDFNIILDPTRIGVNDPVSRPEDWAHINAVYYDEADSSIVASLRNQSTVAKIDYESGSPIWLLGAHGQWPFALQQYLLTPIDESGNVLDVNIAGFWPSAQHAPVKLPNGDILLYDNGNARGLYTGEPDGPLYSRAAQYRIDETAMTVQLVNTFPDHQNWYTLATGDVDYLANTGGRLISFLWGSAQTPRLVELDVEGDVVFEATQNTGSNYYRAEKFRLYDGIE